MNAGGENQSRLSAGGRRMNRRRVREASAWIALIAFGLFWATSVLGISIALADKKVAAWWVVLIFGALPLIGLYRFVERLAHRSADASREQTAPASGTGRMEAAVSELSDGAFSAASAGSTADVQTPALSDPAVVEDLTTREGEVLSLLDKGRTNGEIARELFISTGTVKSHVNSILRKLGARNRTEAVARARRLNLNSQTQFPTG